jgi:hypothetical protein
MKLTAVAALLALAAPGSALSDPSPDAQNSKPPALDLATPH